MDTKQASLAMRVDDLVNQVRRLQNTYRPPQGYNITTDLLGQKVWLETPDTEYRGPWVTVVLKKPPGFWRAARWTWRMRLLSCSPFHGCRCIFYSGRGMLNLIPKYRFCLIARLKACILQMPSGDLSAG